MSWTFEKMLLFLDSIYYYPIIPAFILYKLNKKDLIKIREKDSSSQSLYECIDGQHRFIVISKFIRGESIKMGRSNKYLYIKDKKNNMKLFYTITPAIKEKYKSNIRELDIDERESFNETNLSIQIITQYLDDLSKRNIFNRLQNGERVSVIDKLKNCEHTITNYLRENDYFNPNTLFDYWKHIITIGNIKTKTSININKNKLIYFMIRLILNTYNKNLNINNTNFYITKLIFDDKDKAKVDKPIPEIMKQIHDNKIKIKDKLQNKTITIEFYYLINNLLVNNEIDKFNNLHIVLDSHKLLNKFNNILSTSNTFISIENINKFYNELFDLL